MTTKKSVIYETHGRAREYCELAINLYETCPHGCLYCYVPVFVHKTKSQFHEAAKARISEEDLERAASQWVKKGGHEKRNVLLCFICDPYPPGDSKITRRAIEILHKYGFAVSILTKGGTRAERDFDLLRPGDEFAVTLTLIDGDESIAWEPGAALPGERIHSLAEAHKAGIRTWVSLEPVIYPGQTAHLIRSTWQFVDLYKVGSLNYHPHAKTVDWKAFGWEIKRIMDDLGVKYYFKQDLAYQMGLKDAGGSTAPVSRAADSVKAVNPKGKHYW